MPEIEVLQKILTDRGCTDIECDNCPMFNGGDCDAKAQDGYCPSHRRYDPVAEGKVQAKLAKLSDAKELTETQAMLTKLTNGKKWTNLDWSNSEYVQLIGTRFVDENDKNVPVFGIIECFKHSDFYEFEEPVIEEPKELVDAWLWLYRVNRDIKLTWNHYPTAEEAKAGCGGLIILGKCEETLTKIDKD
jgi:hypothetical protein